MVPPLDETPRTAVRKRESARIYMEYLVQEESSLSSVEQDLQSCDESRTSKPLMITRGTQTRKFRPRFRKPPHRNRGIKLYPKKKQNQHAKRKKTDFAMVNDIILSDIEASESESSDEDLDSETDESYHPDTDSGSYDKMTLKVDPLLLQVNFTQKAALVTRNQSTLYSIINCYYSCPYVWFDFRKM